MSIDERISDALFDYCIAWRDRASAVQDRVEAELRAAIERHVAEVVKAEREVCLNACDSARLSQNSRFGLDGLFVEVANTAIDACMEAIRARADNEVTK